ncbi:MAG: hypothetical protein NVS1B12_12310 [Acidimicrobiales bacterium]
MTRRRRATSPSPRVWPRIARAGAWLVASAAVVAVLVLFVFPTRTYLEQRHQLALATQRLKVLNAANAQLSSQADKLHSNAEIERIARDRYHLVRPGEQAFAILPAPSTTPPPAAHKAAPRHPSLWQRVTSWF